MKTFFKTTIIFSSLLVSSIGISAMEYPFAFQQKNGVEVIDLMDSPEAKTPPAKKQKLSETNELFKTPESQSQRPDNGKISLKPRILFEAESPKKSITLLHSSKTRDCGIDIVKNSWAKLRKGDFIAFMQFRLRNSSVINLLSQKAKEGVDVKIIIGPDDKTSINNARQCGKNGISAYVYNFDKKIENGPFAQIFHYKTAIWKFLKDGKEQCRSWTGSRNDTYQAAKNNEAMIYSKDPEEFKKALGEFNWIHKFCFQLTGNEEIPPLVKGKLQEGISIIATPEKNTRINSLTTNICATITQRIQNSNHELSALLYTIDNKDAQNAFLDRAKNGKLQVLIVDAQATKKKDTNLFLAQLAAFGVNVRVFNPEGRQKFYSYPLIHHTKLILRTQKNGKTLLATGSANLTDHNNGDINHFSFYPCDAALKKDTEALIAHSIKTSVPFPENDTGKNALSIYAKED